MVSNEKTPGVGDAEGLKDDVIAGSSDTIEYSQHTGKCNPEAPLCLTQSIDDEGNVYGMDPGTYSFLIDHSDVVDALSFVEDACAARARRQFRAHLSETVAKACASEVEGASDD